MRLFADHLRQLHEIRGAGLQLEVAVEVAVVAVVAVVAMVEVVVMHIKIPKLQKQYADHLLIRLPLLQQAIVDQVNGNVRSALPVIQTV